MSEVFEPTDQLLVVSAGAEAFRERRQEMAEILKQCFAGYPWYEDLSEEDAQSRIDSHVSKPGFDAIMFEDQDGPIGAIWYDTPSADDLEAERGSELMEFADYFGTRQNIDRIVWVRESAVRPDYQGQGLATRLRIEFLNQLANDGIGDTLILTRMRSDNHAIIAIAQKFDYQPTGIKIPSSQNPEACHEYWYKLVEAGV